MADKKKIYTNMNEILDIVLDDDGGDSDDSFDLDDVSDVSDIFEYEEEEIIPITVPENQDFSTLGSNDDNNNANIYTKDFSMEIEIELEDPEAEPKGDACDVSDNDNNYDSSQSSPGLLQPAKRVGGGGNSPRRETSPESDETDSDDNRPLAQAVRGGRGSVRVRGGRGGVRVRGGRGGVRGVQGGRGGVRGGRGGVRGRGDLGDGQLPLQQTLMLDWEPTELEEEEIFDNTFPFTGVEGLNVRIPVTANSLDFFELYLTETILESIVIETNRFAEQFLRDNPDKVSNKYMKIWEPVDVLEMKIFFAMAILMGIIHKPSINDYWSTDDVLATPIFSKVLSRDKFKLILKFLHFNDNNDPNFDPNDPDRDRLHKVRLFLDSIRKRCQKVFSPGRYLSVDESLVLFKGRLHFRQYIKTKRARFGIKLYELTTSDGITLDVLVYCGCGMFDDDNVETSACHPARGYRLNL